MWINRTIMSSPFHIGLCTTQKQFNRATKKLGYSPGEYGLFISREANATTHSWTREDFNWIIVCLRKTKQKLDVDTIGLIVHESVHVWQHIVESIGESNPSSEFEAYGIQQIVVNLIDVYNKQKVVK